MQTDPQPLSPRHQAIAQRYDAGARRHRGISAHRRDYFAELRALLGEAGVPVERGGLDVGCGRGELGACLGIADRLSGVDLSPRALDVARGHGYARVFPGEACAALASLQQRFAVVYAVLVLEMAPDAGALMDAMAGVLEPGGWLVVTAPDFRSRFFRAWRWKSRLARLAGIAPLKQNPKAVQEARRAAERLGLQTVLDRAWRDSKDQAADLAGGLAGILARALVAMMPGTREVYRLLVFRKP